ncbi:hypothetical protein [Hymenobacter glacieicola]|uniref:Uncharacterized protein n=1 Tax=Hymenobacter glacieicola TaxID=1562124 RepID=A0ABQ1WQI3_9BACT|nr:hypothetical protein [Hymenobacter glacieicola]GGG38769.1 hypothetical protein GCM10011378_13830 [Hymenobacter glacieicola]
MKYKYNNHSWRNTISQSLGIQEGNMLLVLHRYAQSSPEKYYNTEAFNDYYVFLKENLHTQRNNLLHFIKDRAEGFNISYKTLEAINRKNIHECIVKDKDAVFIDEHINYNYLQLLEGSLLIHIQLATYIMLNIQGKKTDNLDLFTCIEKLSKTVFPYLNKVYDNNIRNGIGHGKIIYKETKAHYIDKKENQTSIYYYQFIRKFDLLVDIINGFSLAYIKFYIIDLKSLGVELPRHLFFEEIRLSSTFDNWNISTVIHQQILNKKQLVVNIESKCKTQKELENNIVKTAIQAGKLASKKFDILHIHITHNKFPGFINFDIDILNDINQEKFDSHKDISKAITNSLEMYLAGFNQIMPPSMNPNIFISDTTKYKIIDNSEFVNKLKFKDINQHVNATNKYMIVETKYVYDEQNDSKDIMESLIKSSLENLRNHSIKKSNELTKQHNYKYLNVKYLNIWVYKHDKRGRNLNSNGIKPNLICKISYNSSNEIRNINLLDSKVEYFNEAIINWNYYWRNPEAYDIMFPE